MRISSSDTDYVGAVIGAIIGVLVVIVIVIVFVVLLMRYRKRRHHHHYQNRAQKLVGKDQEQSTVQLVSKNDNGDNNTNKKQYQQLSSLTTAIPSATPYTGQYDNISNSATLSPGNNNHHTSNTHQYATAAVAIQPSLNSQYDALKKEGKPYDNVPITIATEPTASNNQVPDDNIPK
jgi:hypothetical protein